MDWCRVRSNHYEHPMFPSPRNQREFTNWPSNPNSKHLHQWLSIAPNTCRSWRWTGTYTLPRCFGTRQADQRNSIERRISVPTSYPICSARFPQYGKHQQVPSSLEQRLLPGRRSAVQRCCHHCLYRQITSCVPRLQEGQHSSYIRCKQRNRRRYLR